MAGSLHAHSIRQPAGRAAGFAACSACTRGGSSPGVPPPRGHCLRYHGVLAPGAKWRATVVRDRSECRAPTPSSPLRVAALHHGLAPLRERYLCWADLIRRVFSSEVLSCPRCSAGCRVIATIIQPEVICAILTCLELPARGPQLPTRRASRGAAAASRALSVRLHDQFEIAPVASVVLPRPMLGSATIL
jgi:hypothetical protein